jgi:hypothetical protein
MRIQKCSLRYWLQVLNLFIAPLLTAVCSKEKAPIALIQEDRLIFRKYQTGDKTACISDSVGLQRRL